MKFTGVITSVDFQKGTGATGTIVLSGHGPAVLLANSIQCHSYEEGSSLSQVANDTVNGHSKEHLKVSYGEGTDTKLPYTVQYNESDLSFLQRLCSRYGVWLYHNGSKLCIGRTDTAQVDGTVGLDVPVFNLSTSLKERSFAITGHDWVNDILLEANSYTHKPKSSHPYLDTINKESKIVFNKKGGYDYTVGQHEYSGHGGIDTATKVNALGKGAAMVIASGTSELPQLRVGDSLTLNGINFSDSKKKDSYGSYDIVKITHHLDHSGHYHNEFEAVPEGSKHPPYSNGFAANRAGAQRGRVLDNADPQGLGRIKVQFSWQKAMSTSTPWIKTATPYSGDGKGFYFIPEKNEEVLVGFEGDNPEKPFVLSAGYNSSAKSGFADPDNNIKAIKTRSGHLIELNDTDKQESITITDKNSNIIRIDTANNSIEISALENMTLNAKNFQLNVEEDANINVGKNTTIETGENLDMTSTNMTNTVDDKLREEIGGKYSQIALETDIQSDGDIKIQSAGLATLKGGSDVKISKG